jgi:hypothetical protein
MLTPVLEGLQQMHARDLAHRDVKPGNILISSSGLGMLSNFGLAKELRGRANTRHIGCLPYMAPEIEEGHYSVSIDVFAFGVVLLSACGVKLTKPLRVQADVDAAIAQIPSDYSESFIAGVRAALTIENSRVSRPSANDILKMTFWCDDSPASGFPFATARPTQRQHELAQQKEESVEQQQQRENRVVFKRVRGGIGDVDVDANYTAKFGTFSTVAAPAAKISYNCKLFYEFEVLAIGANSCPQAGFASGRFDLTIGAHSNKGVGDDEHSWGVDGRRVRRWHDGSEEWGEEWAVGDVIGCAADLANNKILFSRNGNWQAPMGCAFEGDGVAEHVGNGVFPAITASDTTIRANFGEQAWRFGPPDSTFHIQTTRRFIEDIKYCIQCGLEISNLDHFCIGCGLSTEASNHNYTKPKATQSEIRATLLTRDWQMLETRAKAAGIQPPRTGLRRRKDWVKWRAGFSSIEEAREVVQQREMAQKLVVPSDQPPMKVLCAVCEHQFYPDGITQYCVGEGSQSHEKELFTNIAPKGNLVDCMVGGKSNVSFNCPSNCHGPDQWLVDAGTGSVDRRGYKYAIDCGPEYTRVLPYLQPVEAPYSTRKGSTAPPPASPPAVLSSTRKGGYHITNDNAASLLDNNSHAASRPASATADRESLSALPGNQSGVHKPSMRSVYRDGSIVRTDRAGNKRATLPNGTELTVSASGIDRAEAGAQAKPKVFISWRIAESKAEVTILSKALEALGIEVIVIGELPGGNLLRAVSEGMTKADMFVIMGTKTYGTTTSGLIDTNTEMQQIITSKKPYLLLNMNPESSLLAFEEPDANLVLNLKKEPRTWERWEVGQPMDDALPDKIAEMLAAEVELATLLADIVSRGGV